MKHKMMTTVIVAIATSWTTSANAQDGPSPIVTLLASTDVIVEAEIVAVHTRWQEGFVVSEVVVEITHCVHGQCPREVVSFQVVGGEIDGIVQVVSGSRVPRVGQEMVLLLAQTVSSYTAVLAHLPIVRDRTGQRLVAFSQFMIDLDELRHLVLNSTGD